MTNQEQNEQIVPGIPDAALAEFLERRALARQATGLIGDVLEVDVTVSALMQLASNAEPKNVRLPAKRALRCIAAISREDSPVTAIIGKAGLYHFVEGTILFGASERTYLGLMEVNGLSAEEVTGLYALRKAISDMTDGSLLGFPTIGKALTALGISPQEAASDVDGTLQRFDEAGYFVDHAGGVEFDHLIFWSKPTSDQTLGANIDTVSATDDAQWTIALLRDRLAADNIGLEPEE